MYWGENFDRITSDLVVEDLSEIPVEFEARPQYKSLLLAEELNGINLKVIRAGYLPTLRGFASYNRGLQRNDLFDASESPWFPTTLVGVSLNLPIFDGLEKKAKLDRANVSLEKVRLQKSMFEESMTLEVRNATSNLENTRGISSGPQTRTGPCTGYL